MLKPAIVCDGYGAAIEGALRSLLTSEFTITSPPKFTNSHLEYLYVPNVTLPTTTDTSNDTLERLSLASCCSRCDSGLNRGQNVGVPACFRLSKSFNDRCVASSSANLYSSTMCLLLPLTFCLSRRSRMLIAALWKLQ